MAPPTAPGLLPAFSARKFLSASTNNALQSEPRTVLLVSHDVEEALWLCDRVVVLAGGQVEAELEVELARSGSRREVVTSPAFVGLRERALEAIG